MTTEAAARQYEAQHLAKWGEKGWACYNPHGKAAEELPTIYGFNNGGGRGFYHACLIAEDGTSLGEHCCSSEGYMPHDLGVLEGSRPDRHETFRSHYPDGYRMVFVPYAEVDHTPGLLAAFEMNETKAANSLIREEQAK